MFRYRACPPSPPLDDATAERLLTGAPLDDLPATYRPLGELLAAASGPPRPHELRGSTAAAAGVVAAHAAANGSRRRHRSMVASVLTAVAVVASTGTAMAATQGALPEPVQAVAHQALGAVGISVPDINDDASTSSQPGITAPAASGAPSNPAAGSPARAADTPAASEKTGT